MILPAGDTEKDYREAYRKGYMNRGNSEKLISVQDRHEWEVNGDIILAPGVLSRQWNDKYYLYPISYTERVKNPHLEQNPGWED